MIDPSVWLPTAYKKLAVGELQHFPAIRCHVAGLLKHLWPAFAKEHGLPEDCRQPPAQLLPQTTFERMQNLAHRSQENEPS